MENVGFRRWFGVLGLVAVVVLLLVPGSVGGGVSLATAAGSADLSVNVTDGPTVSSPGLAFSFNVKVSSLGPDLVSGVTVEVDQPGAVNVVVPTNCVGINGAICPTSWTVTGSKLTGVLGALPANSELSFSYAGKFAATMAAGASVRTTASLVLPAGVTDPNLGGNTSYQATTFPQGTATVSKTAALASSPSVPLVGGSANLIVSGSEIVWTIRVVNTSSVVLTGGKWYDYFYQSGSFEFSHVAGSLSCTVDGVVCSPMPVLANLTGIYPFNGLEPVPDVPPGKELVIKFDTVVTRTSCGMGYFRNNAQYFANNFPQREVSAPYLYMSGPPCLTATVSKTAALASNPTVPLVGGAANPIPSGSEFIWTIRVVNTSSVVLTGGKWYDYFYQSGSFEFSHVAGSLSCTVDGVACSPSPVFTRLTGLYPFSGVEQSVPDVPPGKELVIKFNTKATRTSCGLAYFYNRAFYSATNLPEISEFTSYLYMSGPPCLTATVTKTAALASSPSVPLVGGSANPIVSGSEIVWTIRVVNTSSVALTGGKWHDYLNWNLSSVEFRHVAGSLSCTVDGVVCSPAQVLANLTGDLPFSGDQLVPDVPPGKELVIKFNTKATRTSCGLGYFYNRAFYSANNLPEKEAATPYLYMSPFDLGVSVVPSSMVVAAGGVVSLDATLTNACAVPTDTTLSWQLPSASDFDFAGVTAASVQCTPPAGKTCPVFSFDPVTRKLTAPFVGVDQGVFKIKVFGKAGVVKGVSSPTTVSLVSPPGDANASSDSASVTFTVQNEQTVNTVDYTITAKGVGGVALPGVPAALVVTGKISCVKQGDFPWSLTIAKDAQQPPRLSAATVPWQQPVWNQDTCHYVIDPVVAPSGWKWKTPLAITSVDTGTDLVQATARNVVVTGELVPLDVPMVVEKQGSNCDVGQPSCPLPGASFTIYATDPTGASPTIAGMLTPDATTTPANYRFAVAGLSPGDYWLVESRTPTGFSLLAAPVKFRLAEDGTITLLGTDTGLATITPGTGTTPATLVVHDQPVVKMPAAGGPGIWWLALTGTLLLAAGLTLHRITNRH